MHTSFTLTIAGCKNCPYLRGSNINKTCSKILTAPLTYKVVTDNMESLTPTCPMVIKGTANDYPN
jgi:hypothetical protein